MLLAEGRDELDVGRLVATGGQHAQVSLSAVQRLHSLVQSTGKAVVEQRGAEDLLQSRLGVERSLLLDLGLSLHVLNINNNLPKQWSDSNKEGMRKDKLKTHLRFFFSHFRSSLFSAP